MLSRRPRACHLGVAILSLAASIPGAVAQNSNSTGTQVALATLSDPICGFLSGPHRYDEAAQVKRGLAVDLFVGDVPPNQPVTLRFFVNLKPRSSAVDDLQVEHEKMMHVIGVRDDLGDFFHIHPAKVSSGMWEVQHTFTNGGNYKIWTDLKYHGTSYSFRQPTLRVKGPSRGASQPLTIEDRAKISGYEVTLSRSGSLTVGKTNEFIISIRDSSGQLAETEKFLGAAVHLVIIRNDLSVFLHAHPEPRGASDGSIRFNQVFPKPGTYKLFAEFRPKGAKLSAGDPLLATMCFQVLGSQVAGSVASSP